MGGSDTKGNIKAKVVKDTRGQRDRIEANRRDPELGGGMPTYSVRAEDHPPLRLRGKAGVPVQGTGQIPDSNCALFLQTRI